MAKSRIVNKIARNEDRDRLDLSPSYDRQTEAKKLHLNGKAISSSNSELKQFRPSQDQLFTANV